MKRNISISYLDNSPAVTCFVRCVRYLVLQLVLLQTTHRVVVVVVVVVVVCLPRAVVSPGDSVIIIGLNEIECQFKILSQIVRKKELMKEDELIQLKAVARGKIWKIIFKIGNAALYVKFC